MNLISFVFIAFVGLFSITHKELRRTPEQTPAAPSAPAVPNAAPTAPSAAPVATPKYNDDEASSHSEPAVTHS